MNLILDWAEVWSLFFPLSIVMFGKRQPAITRPIILYLVCGLAINMLGNLIWKFDLLTYNGVSYNGFLYNIHSIVRFILFDLYFIRLGNRKGLPLSKIIRISFAAFVIVNFTFFEAFYDPASPFSSLLLSVESVLLLLLCLQYYFHRLTEEVVNRFDQPDIWMVTGLSIYVVVNFFIFLLYDAINRLSVQFAINIWILHNISYVVSNLFIAKSLYESQYRRH